MIVGLLKPLPPSYLDMFKYEGPVEIGGRGDAVVDAFAYGAGGRVVAARSRMKAM
jgi:hypothetical protein